jgi:hypothetical protein
MGININSATATKEASQDKNQLPLTSLEIIFNRIFTVLLVLSTLALLLNLLTIPTIVIFTIFAFFLFFSKKYHLFTNIIFFIFALGVYFIPLPIGWGWFLQLKEFRMGGFNFNILPIFFIAPLIFISFSVRNVLGNIFAYFKTSTVSRNVYYFLSLFLVFATLLAYPFLGSVKLRERAMEDDDGSSQLSYVLTKQELKIKPGKTSASSTAFSRDYTAQYDSINNKYIYRLNLVDSLTESITFVAVKVDGEKINFITDNRVQCLNCQKDVSDPYSLVFPAGKDIDFIITNDQMMKEIKFTEPGDKVADFVFWK